MSPMCPTLLLLLAMLPSALLAQTSDQVVTTVQEALDTRLAAETASIETRQAAQTASLETHLAAQTASLGDRLEDRLDAQTASIETRLAAQTASLEDRLEDRLDAQTASIETRLAAQTAALHEKIASLEMAKCCEGPATTATLTQTPATTPTVKPSTTPTTTVTAATTPTTTEAPLPVVFLRRQDGSVDFYRDWAAYKSGFGNQAGEFWLGLDNLHTLTTRHNYGLRADLTDWSGETKWAEYSTFLVAGEGDGYRLTVSGFNLTSTAGDSMSRNHGERFSTRDRDNDGHGGGSCADYYRGAWWYGDCTIVNPTGPYKPAGYRGSQGIYWWDAYNDWRSFKRVTLTLVIA